MVALSVLLEVGGNFAILNGTPYVYMFAIVQSLYQIRLGNILYNFCNISLFQKF